MFPSQTKILVVDDFASMRKIIKKVLADLNYTNVEEAQDGKVALHLLQTRQASDSPFQFIISDWKMPEMSGIDLLRACKSNPRLQHLPFILIAAETEQKNILDAARAGVSDYIVKPFDAETLSGKLEKIWLKLHPPGSSASGS